MHSDKNSLLDFRSFIKKITFVFVILYYLQPAAFAQFRKIHYETTDNEVRKFSFYSASEGYIAFENNIGFTTDSGHTVAARSITLNNTDFNHNDVNITFGFTIKGVKALSKNNIIAYGDYANVPAILYSSDGGAHFKLVFHSQYSTIPNSEVNDMQFFPDGKTGYAIDNDRILKTTDGGLSWQISSYFSHGYGPSLQIVNNTVIAFFKTELGVGTLLVLKNGERNWAVARLPDAGAIQCVYFLNESKGWANNSDGQTFVTQDGGATWTNQTDVSIFYFAALGMTFTNETTGYAFDNSNNVYKTTDAGKIWERLVRNNVPATTYPVIEMQILGNNIWGGGGHGYIELSTNGGGIPVPKAAFKIDTAGLSTTGKSKLLNFSKTGYSYKWIVNGKQISTDYNASYPTDEYGPGDTITLIASNGRYADTAVRSVFYGKGMAINSFSPNEGATHGMIEINGFNFNDATSVTFGGVPAERIEKWSNTYMRVYVGKGASGRIKISSAKSSVTSKESFTYLAAPVITSFSPQIAKRGDVITIKGHYFNHITDVAIGTYYAQSYNVVSDSVITAVVNYAKSTGVYVRNPLGQATLSGFKSLPVIDSISPKAGNYGSVIGLYGPALGEATSITVDGNPVLALTDTIMGDLVHIKLGEGTKGVIKVVTKNGSYTFNGLTYYQRPRITSFAPLAAPAGESVVISGEGFSSKTAENFVYFNNTKAIVTKASATSLTVTVPPGATYGPINVTTHSSAVISGGYFTPTFKNAKPLYAGAFITTLENKDYPSHNFQLVDVNDDGKPDIVTPQMGSYRGSRDIQSSLMAGVYANTSQTGVFSFATNQLFYSDYGGGSYDGGGAVMVMDNDYDGRLDLVIMGTFNNDIKTLNLKNYKPAGLEVSYSPWNNIDGYYMHTAGFDMRNRDFGFAVSDFDADGQLDRIVFMPQYTIYKNIQPANLDNDDKPDAINIAGQKVNVLKNISTKGNISFSLPIAYDMGSEVKNITIADIDGDGKTDIVVCTSAGSLVVLKNNSVAGGSLSFTPIALASGISNVNNNTVGDVDGDGKADILLSTGDNVNIYKNTSKAGTITVAPPVSFALKGDTKLGVADMDNDGRPDIVGLSNSDGYGVISILKNVIGSPVITFSPAAGAIGATVEIKGENLSDATNVKIGGIPVKSFTINSATSITAKIDKVATGAVVVEKPGDYPVSLKPFIFVPKPDIVFYGPLVFETGGNVGLNTNNYDSFLSYQWQKDGINIPDGTYRGYIAKETGSYTLINKYGNVAVTSDPVIVRTTFTLPADNFKLSATNVTCSGAGNGALNITAAKAMNYSALITSVGYSKTFKFNKTLAVTGLNGGAYNICITIDDHAEFNQCFSLSISEPRDLYAYAAVNNSDVTLTMDGGDVYNIRINDKAYTTKENNITLPLSAGTNNIQITTDKLCQGIFQKLISYLETPRPYPNPFVNTVNINLGNKIIGNADIIVRDVENGKQLFKANYQNQSGVVSLNLASLKTGVYILKVNIDGRENTFKLLK